MKNFKNLILVIMCLALFLSGCGSTKTNGIVDDTESNNSTSNTENLLIEKNEYTLSEYLLSEERIWYLTEGFGKDDKIKAIYVTEPNGSMYYCESDWTLGQAEQKEDDEIIAYVKQTYEENMEEYINGIIERKGASTFDGILISDTKTILNPYVENIEPATWKLSIVTDSTGNNTEREVFAFQQFAPITFYDDLAQIIVNVELSSILSAGSEEATANCFPIYDSWYGGAKIQDNYCNCEAVFQSYECGENCPRTRIDTSFAYMLTRFDSNKLFDLDNPGADNVGIDNRDSLFEELKIDLEYEHINVEG